MRETVKDKIQFFYRDRFEHLESCYQELLSIEYNIRMIGATESLNSGNGGEIIDINTTIGYNSQLVLSEISDDLNCSLELIKSAYFKQSNQILRNTIELITQLIFEESLLNEKKDLSTWIKGQRGADYLPKMIECLKKKVPTKYKTRINEIKKFYNLLNQSTHSHKNQLNIKGISKFDKIGVFDFEYTQFQNSFIIHLSCLDIILEFIKYFYSKFPSDYFKIELVKKLDYISDKLKIYSDDIDNYKKGEYEKGEGFLIYKKHMFINGESLLYSFKANNEILWASKKKGKQSDSKLIGIEIDKELTKKKIIST